MAEAAPIPRRPAPPGGALVGAIGWSGLGVALSGLTRFGYSVLLGHLGGLAVLGTVNTLISLALLAGLAGPNAAGSAASKFLARALGAGELAGARLTWRTLVRTGAALAVVVALLACTYAAAELHRSPGQVVVVLFLVLSLAACTLVRGARFGTGGFARAAAAEGVAAVVSLGLLALVLVVGHPGAALLPLALGYTSYALVAWPRGLGRSAGPTSAGPSGVEPTRAGPSGAGPTKVEVKGAPGRTGSPTSGELRAFISWSVLGGVASAGLLQVSVVIAKAGDTPVRVGQYAAAVAVGTPMALLAVPLSQALFSLLSRSVGGADAAAVRRRTDAATRGLVVLMVAVGGGIALVSRTALAVVGPHLAPAVPLLQVVALAVLVSTLTVPAVASLTSGSQRGVRQVSLMSGAGLVVGLVVMAVCVPPAGTWGLPFAGMGVDGVAAGYAAGTLVTNVLPWCVAWRRHHLGWGTLSVRVLVALAVLIVLVRLPLASTVAGGWVLAVAFSVAWLATCLPEVARLVRGRSRA